MWRGEEGAHPGFDFGLPNHTMPSPHSGITLQRGFGSDPWNELGLPPTKAAGLPQLRFAANAVFSMWYPWKQIEVEEGVYDFRALDANIDAVVASGWRVGLRLLTARLIDAPAHLHGLGLPTLDHGINFDPIAPRFHAAYLALLEQLRARGYCQNRSVVMVYAGYASHDPGDEYIGPHSPDDVGDPAASYPHVRERLDAWARVCEGATAKVLMGGLSAYGSSLGFGTRNGFVEHYW